jgi:hypothetical protein
MTEEEWESCSDPERMLGVVARSASDRKLHYHAIASARKLALLLPNPASLGGIDVLERYVEGEAEADEISKVSWDVEGAAFGFDFYERLQHPSVTTWIREVERLPQNVVSDLVGDTWSVPEDALRLLNSAAFRVDAIVSILPYAKRDNSGSRPLLASHHSVRLLRDIFGNPFRPVAFDPEWRTDTAVSLARRMYESRDFGTMPILADALQDAGCEDEAVLAHCRDPQQVHVRGCWVVDLVLGKA